MLASLDAFHIVWLNSNQATASYCLSPTAVKNHNMVCDLSFLCDTLLMKEGNRHSGFSTLLGQEFLVICHVIPTLFGKNWSGRKLSPSFLSLHTF